MENFAITNAEAASKTTNHTSDAEPTSNVVVALQQPTSTNVDAIEENQNRPPLSPIKQNHSIHPLQFSEGGLLLGGNSGGGDIFPPLPPSSSSDELSTNVCNNDEQPLPSYGFDPASSGRFSAGIFNDTYLDELIGGPSHLPPLSSPSADYGLDFPPLSLTSFSDVGLGGLSSVGGYSGGLNEFTQQFPPQHQSFAGGLNGSAAFGMTRGQDFAAANNHQPPSQLREQFAQYLEEGVGAEDEQLQQQENKVLSALTMPTEISHITMPALENVRASATDSTASAASGSASVSVPNDEDVLLGRRFYNPSLVPPGNKRLSEILTNYRIVYCEG